MIHTFTMLCLIVRKELYKYSNVCVKRFSKILGFLALWLSCAVNIVHAETLTSGAVITGIEFFTTNPSNGKAKPGDQVTVKFNTVGVTQTPVVTIAGQTALVTNTGIDTWDAVRTMTSSDPNAPVAYAISATDNLGSPGSASGNSDITFSNAEPPKPTITSISKLNSLGYTQEKQPSVSGSADPNSLLTLYLDGVKLAEVTTRPSGYWTYTFATALAEKEYVLTATATDSYGNISSLSNEKKFIVDFTALPPDIKTLTGLNGAGYTPINKPVVTGTSEPNSTVRLYINGAKRTELTADANGNWTYTFIPVLADNTYVLTATALDLASNLSQYSAPFNAIVDTKNPAIPAPPVIPANGYCPDNTPTYGGVTEAGATAVVIVDGVSFGPVTADENGKWEITIIPALLDGERNAKIKVTDKAGNSSESTEVKVIIDTVEPDKPGLPVAEDVTVEYGETVVNTSYPTVHGQAEAFSTVEVRADGRKDGEVLADDKGYWRYTFQSQLSDDTHNITVTATDRAGNTSDESDILKLVVVADKLHAVIDLDGVFEKTFLDNDFLVTAVSNSPEIITFTSSNTDVATIDSHGRIHIVGAGSTEITASHIEDATYTSAQTTKTLVVHKATQILTYKDMVEMERFGSRYSPAATTTAPLELKLETSNPFVVKVEGTTLIPQGIGLATITVNQPGDKDYLPAQASFEVSVGDPSSRDIVVSQVLTPNGDGVNDLLRIEGLVKYPEHHLMIVNRNGVPIFESRNYNTLDPTSPADAESFTGTTKDKGNLPEGTYFYIIEYMKSLELKKQTGYFVIKY